jgi:hypothetical protein
MGEQTSGRPWQRATLWLLFLGPFFLATYSFANWLASRRSDVGAIVFEWERYIPFWPWAIVPYWSIDIFYIASLLVCATRRELDTHVRRLIAAQVVAVTCFILFPLRQTSVRPATDGIYSLMFDALASFDQPFNQAPALHIALLIILWVPLARHLHGAWCWLLHAWFVLIAVSVLTTFQHHFIDVPTGLLAGWLCVLLFPDDSAPLLAQAKLSADARRRSLALRYFLCALAIAVLSVALGGWALWLLWVSVSLWIVCAIYLFLNENSFRKRSDGTMMPASQWLLAPYFIGAWLNSRWWTRNAREANLIAPDVWLGRAPGKNAGNGELPPGVNTLIDLSAELPCRADSKHYVNLPVLDLTPLDAVRLDAAARAITHALQNGPVLIYCALGFSRSAAAAAAWLIASGRAADAAGAAAQILKARPQAVLRREQLELLDQYARQLKGQSR